MPLWLERCLESVGGGDGGGRRGRETRVSPTSRSYEQCSLHPIAATPAFQAFERQSGGPLSTACTATIRATGTTGTPPRCPAPPTTLSFDKRTLNTYPEFRGHTCDK